MKSIAKELSIKASYVDYDYEDVRLLAESQHVFSIHCHDRNITWYDFEDGSQAKFEHFNNMVFITTDYR